VSIRFILFLLLLSTGGFASEVVDMKSLRERYYAAVHSSVATEKLYSELKKQRLPAPVILAYVGSLEALRAKHAINPYYKLQYLREADQTMQKAVKAAPDNIEIRFLRFSYQYYVPEFLGYSENKEEDLKVMVALLKAGKYPRQDTALVKNMLGFFEETQSVSRAELKLLKMSLPQS